MKKFVCLISIILILMSHGDGWKHGDGSLASSKQWDSYPVLVRMPYRGGSSQSNVTEEPSPCHVQCKYYDENSFVASFQQKFDNEDEVPSAMGAILPHHLVASPMIARLFTRLSYKVDYPLTIVVLAPNHKRIGDRPIHTGDFTWDTPFGGLKADEKMVGGLIKTLGAGVDPGLLEKEHSIAALIPYIRYCFPEAKIVPILIHGNMKSDDCKALSSFIKKEAQIKRCLILASIDFSHGLTTPESRERDEITKRVIADRDYDTLFSLDNTHLDAPPTLATFLMTMDSLADSGGAEGILAEQGEASQFLKRHVPDTTSYLTYIFTSE